MFNICLDKSPPRSDFEDDDTNNNKQNGDCATEEPEEGENENENGADESGEMEKTTDKPMDTETSVTEKSSTAPRTRMLLHKTSSIFLRNLAPNITRADIETVLYAFILFF